MAALAAVLLAAPMLLRPDDVPAPHAPWAPLDPAASLTWATPWKIARLDRAPSACRRALDRAGARATPLPDRDFAPACHIRDAVRLSRLGAARLAAEAVRCNIALRLALWERHVLQPAAKDLLGSPVGEIRHFGAYSCRAIRTPDGTARRMSEHATANAFDIAGFRLADGREISLVKDWAGGGREADFLRIAHRGLCRLFRVTLGPSYNALHADHFHVDEGPFRTCR
ncbi:MAG: extensin family protein [Pikeienuella sp.]